MLELLGVGLLVAYAVVGIARLTMMRYVCMLLGHAWVVKPTGGFICEFCHEEWRHARRAALSPVQAEPVPNEKRPVSQVPR